MPSFPFLFAVLAWFACLNVSTAAANLNTTSVPLRIMALGASVTFGVGSTTGDSYRKDLEDLLKANGDTVEYVGTRRNGNFSDNAVEATSGFVISQIAASANTAVPQLKPNLVLIDAGTNNCNRGGTVPDAGANVTAMINNIFKQSPGATVILTTVLVNSVAAQDACRVTVNAQYSALATTMQAAGAKMLLVDMRGPGGPLVTDLADGRHPNDAGYVKMANIWFQGIQEVISKGFLTTPLANSTSSTISAAGGAPALASSANATTTQRGSASASASAPGTAETFTSAGTSIVETTFYAALLKCIFVLMMTAAAL